MAEMAKKLQGPLYTGPSSIHRDPFLITHELGKDHRMV